MVQALRWVDLTESIIEHIGEEILWNFIKPLVYLDSPNNRQRPYKYNIVIFLNVFEVKDIEIGYKIEYL